MLVPIDCPSSRFKGLCRGSERGIADALMLLLSGTSIVVSLILTVFMVFNTKNREIEQSHEVDGRGMEDC